MFASPSGERLLGTAAERDITVKNGRYGSYVTDGERSASLFKTMSVDTVSMEESQRLLTVPRTLGVLDGEEVSAPNGRYGPYVKRGTESRSLDSEDQLFTVTHEQARADTARGTEDRGPTTGMRSPRQPASRPAHYRRCYKPTST